MSKANEGCIRRMVRWMFRHRHKWVHSQKTSIDRQTVYRLRTCRTCGKVEIQNIFGYWHDVSTVKFSSVPQFETWHRERFETAVGLPNTGNEAR